MSSAKVAQNYKTNFLLKYFLKKNLKNVLDPTCFFINRLALIIARSFNYRLNDDWACIQESLGVVDHIFKHFKRYSSIYLIFFGIYYDSFLWSLKIESSLLSYLKKYTYWIFWLKSSILIYLLNWYWFSNCNFRMHTKYYFRIFYFSSYKLPIYYLILPTVFFEVRSIF